MVVKNMLAFKRENTKDVAMRLGYTISKEEDIIENGTSLVCPSCNKSLTIKNLGVISTGSKIVFCNNPACYAKYLAEKEKEK